MPHENTCATCGSFVDKYAKVCPNCGRNSPGYRQSTIEIIIVSGVATLGFYLFMKFIFGVDIFKFG
jgi:hypothetical protein